MPEKQQNNIDSSTSIATVLKRCREYHGISIYEASEATKIGEHYLLALESEQSKESASLTYTKGYLRAYANYLGLNPDDILRLYDKQLAEKKEKKAGAVSRSRRDQSTNQRVSLKKYLLPLVLLLLIIITAKVINRSDNKQATNPAPATVALQSNELRPVQAIQPVRSSSAAKSAIKPEEQQGTEIAQSTEKTAESNNTSAEISDKTKSFIVKMRVTQNGNLTVTIDDNITEEHELAVGDAIEWKAEKTVAFELSNAGGVEISLNGKTVNLSTTTGKPASLVIGAGGIKK